MRVIAIDGPSGSGKSTVARALAQKLGLDYLDTGAMYRAVAFAAIRNNVDPADAEPVATLTHNLDIEVADQVTVDGVDATIEIRGPEVTRAVSIVAANPEVRADLRERQRQWARDHHGGVIEGRDIGTVVFPDAELKVYLTAEDTERAKRRQAEAVAMHYDPAAAVDEVRAEMARRDHMDSTRAVSPLAVADDAVKIDTTDRSVDDIVADLVGLLESAATSPTEPSEDAEKTAKSDKPTYRPQPKGRAGEAFDRVLYAFCRGALAGFSRLYWRLSVEGADNLPAHGAYIVAPVHRSNVDFALVGAMTRRRLRFMGKDSLWKSRPAARFLSALGGFPVNRGAADRDALRRCIAVIEGGEPLVLFPEGTRQSGDTVAELFEGAAYVAARTGVPIVPVGIAGSEKAMPKGKKLLYPSRVTMVVGAPLSAPPSRSRKAVHAMTLELHDELQKLFDAARVRTTSRS